MNPGSSYTEKHDIAIELNVLQYLKSYEIESMGPIIGQNKARFTQAALTRCKLDYLYEGGFYKTRYVKD